MYKISVPINIGLLTEDSKPKFVAELKRDGVERVFLFSAEPFTRTNCYLYSHPECMSNAISYFKDAGFEVGVWMDAFGHGGVLAHSQASEYIADFVRIRGSDGRMTQEGFCPLDPGFREGFKNAIRLMAEMNPDIIMFDDDFRMNIRKYHMGCCCDRHMKILCERLGEEVPYQKLEELAFTGGENKYRTAWMKLMGETLLDLCHEIREVVDSVNPAIRVSACAVYSTWDFDGTDMIAISKALAGQTRPYLRTFGAPYHCPRIQYAVEHTRMQAAWCKNENIEIFAEGDVYPRPRYAVPARHLEIFDLSILASGCTEGCLKYMFDYNQPFGYEMGYTERHLKNAPLREGLKEIFAKKHHVGLRVFEAMHKIEKYEFPKIYEQGIATTALNTYYSIAQKLASENAIPTVYESSDVYPTIVFGENARYIEREDMKNGAILDAVAARILTERGFDVGYLHSGCSLFSAEHFIEENDDIRGISNIAMHRAEISADAKVDSTFLPDRAPASYFYENKNGEKYFVLLIDGYNSDKNCFNYFNNYYRQSQLIRAIEWLSEHTLPAVIRKHPYLYMQAARSIDDSALSIALFNTCDDEVIMPTIELDRDYKTIRCVGCKAEIQGNKVYLLSDIEPYGMAAFEVK